MKRDGQNEIRELRAKYRGEILIRQTEINDLREKIGRIKEFQMDRDKYLGSLPTKYRGFGMTESVIDAVASLNHGASANGELFSEATATNVAKYVQRCGFGPITPNYRVSIHMTLGRLVKSGRLKASNINGHKRYSHYAR
jgi:hypothetical protein